MSELIDIINKQLETQESIYSFHVFLFPFQWRYKDNARALLEDQSDLPRLQTLMDRYGHPWVRRKNWYPPKNPIQYSELAYFYEFVHPVLYDSGDDGSLLRHYYYQFSGKEDRGEYHIALPHGTLYKLLIDDIVLSFYNTGVGLLALHLYNTEQNQSAPQDIININYYGRRIYPPFLASNTDLFGTQAYFEDDDLEKALQKVKYEANQLAESLSIYDGNGALIVKDDFSSWALSPDPTQIPALIGAVFPSILIQQLQLNNVLDDRMFTLCWYGNQEMVRHMQGAIPHEYYKHHEWWSQYVYVDQAGTTIQNREMHERLMTATTNARWANYGTYYGITQYSFVVLTSEGSAGHFNKLLATHAMTMYYKLALLALVQRTCLLRFSKEVSAISQLSKTDKNIAARISSLYKQYIRFINKIYFREVSTQEQGIELYDLLQEQMWLDQQVKDLDREIQELHQYVNLLEEDRRNNKLDMLTYIGAFFVVPSFIGTYFGVSDYQMKEHWWELSLFSLLASLLVFLTVRSNNQWRLLWLILTGLLMILLLFIYPAFRF